jgi:hypothetical protein
MLLLRDCNCRRYRAMSIGRRRGAVSQVVDFFPRTTYHQVVERRSILGHDTYAPLSAAIRWSWRAHETRAASALCQALGPANHDWRARLASVSLHLLFASQPFTWPYRPPAWNPPGHEFTWPPSSGAAATFEAKGPFSHIPVLRRHRLCSC